MRMFGRCRNEEEAWAAKKTNDEVESGRNKEGGSQGEKERDGRERAENG